MTVSSQYEELPLKSRMQLWDEVWRALLLDLTTLDTDGAPSQEGVPFFMLFWLWAARHCEDQRGYLRHIHSC